MYDFSQSPFKDPSKIVNVVMENAGTEKDGKLITSIGDNVFNKCSNMTSVNMLNSIKRIGNNAFRDCTSFAYIMKDWGWFYPGIQSSIDGAISPNFSSPDINMETLTEALGGNSFMAWIILSITHPTTVPEVVEAITMLIMKCIAFGIIFLGTFVIIIILVIVAKVLRKSKGVRVIDGILGMVFSLVIYTATVSLLLFFLNLIYKYAGWTDLNNWLDVDMQLTTDSFRLSKWLFNGNLFTFIVSLFQPK